jgi:hypothetical protein
VEELPAILVMQGLCVLQLNAKNMQQVPVGEFCLAVICVVAYLVKQTAHLAFMAVVKQ